MITELNERAQTVLRYIVDSYMETGEPVGSRTLSKMLDLGLSPATIRNVMADLETEGFLFAPHTSAGRLPTQQGMRLYVDGLMEVGDLSEQERTAIEDQCRSSGQSMASVLERTTSLLSGLSAAAGLVIAPKTGSAEKPVQQIQFIPLERGKVLVVLVMQDNMVENRVMDVPADLPPSALSSAANYLNNRLSGKNLAEARKDIRHDIEQNRTQLDKLTQDLVERGLALAPLHGLDPATDGHIIIRGQSKLLQDVRAVEDIERARHLFAALEEQETIFRLLESAQGADGVQIFIGTENRMFEHSGWSMVLSPYKTPDNKLIGAIGVIGPVRLNYGRIIPVVDYTAKIMGRLIGG